MKKIMVVLLLISVLFIGGCVGDGVTGDITSVIKTLPEVQEFLKENPDAEMTAVLWSSEYISENLDNIRSDCIPAIQSGKAYYKIDINEESEQLTIFMDSEEREVVCAFTEDLTEQSVEAPKITTTTRATTTTITTTTAKTTIEENVLEIISISDRLSSSGKYMYITGEVENKGSYLAEFVKVTVKFYKNGEFIDRDYTYADGTDIRPYKTDTFEIMWEIIDYDYYQISATGRCNGESLYSDEQDVDKSTYTTSTTKATTSEVTTTIEKTKSAELTIDKIQITLANLYPTRVTVENTGEAAIYPKFDLYVYDEDDNEVCSGSPLFSFGAVSPDKSKTDEISILGCMFTEDGEYELKIDLFDSDYNKLDTDTKTFTVDYWDQFGL